MILTVLAVLTLSDQPTVTARRDAGHVAAAAPAEETAVRSITAPRAMTTDEQIAAWIGASPATPMEIGDGPIPYDAPFEPERRVRGQVSAAIGSHGYRGFGVDVGMNFGESGFASLHYSETKGRLGAYRACCALAQDLYGVRYRSRFASPLSLDFWDVSRRGLVPGFAWGPEVPIAPDASGW